LAPDAFVHFGEPDSLFRSWKTWERGTLDVAVEIVGESEDSDRDVEAKVARYQRLGVTELVRFDPQATEQALRVWDRIGQELVERSLTALTAQSRCLPGYWVVVEDAKVGPALRLSRDAGATDLYLTEAEANARRVRELEALLQQRG
jgi:Uma2 family endonuclease